MGFDLNDFVTEGSDKGDFDVIKYAIRKLTDDVSPVITQLMGDVPRIELFARQKVPGWDAWGNEVKSDISMEGSDVNGVCAGSEGSDAS